MVMFFDLFFALLYEIPFTLMIFRKSVILAIRTIALTAFKTQQTNFLMANETFSMVGLFRGNWWLWDFQCFDFLTDLIGLAVLSE